MILTVPGIQRQGYRGIQGDENRGGYRVKHGIQVISIGYRVMIQGYETGVGYRGRIQGYDTGV